MTAKTRRAINSFCFEGLNVLTQSGSVVAMLDARYGRAALLRLLPLTTPEEVFGALATDETAVLTAWKSWIKSR